MTDSTPFGGLRRYIEGSLQRRFAAMAVLLLVLTSTVFLALVVYEYRSHILEAHERASMNVNLLLQAALENSMIKRDLAGLQDIVTRLGHQDGIAGVMIVHPSGEVRFSSYPDRLFEPIGDPQFDLARDRGEQIAGFRQADGAEVLRSINPVRNKPACRECHGEASEHPINGLLVVDYEASGVRRSAMSGALLLGGLGVLVVLATVGGLWIALRRIVLNRVDMLSDATRRIAEGDLHVRVGDSASDELGDLGRSFNAMGARLERSVEELRTSESFLQDLVDAIPDGIRVIDGNFRVLLVNRTYCDQVGLSRDSVLAVPCHRSSHNRTAPCTATLLCCPVAEVLHGDLPHIKCSHTHTTAAGDNRRVEVFAVPARMHVDGQPVECVVESIRDLEAEVSFSQEQRLAEMAMVAAGVAHEVYNPLSSIALALRSIRDEIGSTGKARQYIDIAETEIANCQSITESLLRLAAAPGTGSELVEMARVVTDTTALLRLEAAQAEVELNGQTDGAPRVLARDSDMRILIFNLALNAIHAMPGGGRADITCRAECGRVVIRVADTGVGIRKEDRDKVLLPFWTKRADGSRGRGLGLSICSSIVEGLGGTISFESEVGVGTTFTIDLPSADKEDA